MIEKPANGLGAYTWMLPVVGETFDAYLNDMNGFHVTPAHVMEALDSTSGGAVAEGNVGGGTGMICFEFKGGTGTSSRVVDVLGETYTVGCLVQANFGIRPLLKGVGSAVGEHITADSLWARSKGRSSSSWRPTHRSCRRSWSGSHGARARNWPHGNAVWGRIRRSVPCVLDRQSEQERSGSHSQMGSLTFLPNNRLDTLFEATAQAVEEAIVNAMAAADTMVGREGRCYGHRPRCFKGRHAPLRTIARMS